MNHARDNWYQPGQLVAVYEKGLPNNYKLTKSWTYEYVTGWGQSFTLPCDCIVFSILTMVFETTTTANYYNRMAGRLEFDYSFYVAGWYDVIHNTSARVMAVNSRTTAEYCVLGGGDHTARVKLMGASTSGVTLVTANNARSKFTIICFKLP